jgi:hypothetical protein
VGVNMGRPSLCAHKYLLWLLKVLNSRDILVLSEIGVFVLIAIMFRVVSGRE